MWWSLFVVGNALGSELRPRDELVSTENAGGRSIVSVVPVKRECPPGFSLTTLGDRCTKREVKPAKAICDVGTLGSEGCALHEVTPTEKKCPDGAAFNGSVCTFSTISAATLVCESGEELVNGECWRTENLPPKHSCPKGFNFNALTEKCQSRVALVPEFLCPDGFDREPGGACVRTIATPSEARCDADSFLADGYCVSTHSREKTKITCLSGGETDVRGRCVKNTTVDTDIVCPQGYSFGIDQKRCEKPHISLPTLKCPKDFVLEGDRCVMTARPEQICETPGSTLTDRGCVSLDQVAPRKACPHRSVPTPEGRCAVQVVYENDYVTDCSAGFHLVGTSCHRITTEPPYAQTCPPGATLHGNKCIREERSPVSPFCRSPDAEFDKGLGQCVRYVSIEPVTTCPKNSEFRQGGCALRKSRTASASCEGAGRLRQVGVLQECIATQETPPALICEAGSSPSSAGQCVRTSVTKPRLVCENKPALEETLEGEECIRIVTVNPGRLCPPGFRAFGNACVGKLASNEPGDGLSQEDREIITDSILTPEVMTANLGKKAVAMVKKVAAVNLKMQDDQTLLGLADYTRGAATPEMISKLKQQLKHHTA